MVRFFRRHQAKIAVGLAVAFTAALIAHKQIERIFVPVPEKAPPAPTKHHKGVDAGSGNHNSPSGQPGPAPSGGGASGNTSVTVPLPNGGGASLTVPCVPTALTPCN